MQKHGYNSNIKSLIEKDLLVSWSKLDLSSPELSWMNMSLQGYSEREIKVINCDKRKLFSLYKKLSGEKCTVFNVIYPMAVSS